MTASAFIRFASAADNPIFLVPGGSPIGGIPQRRATGSHPKLERFLEPETELETAREPAASLRVEAGEHRREVVVVLSARVTRLEEQDDLRPRERETVACGSSPPAR